MLQQKLDSADIALATILQDPILSVEFLRNIKDGAKNKDLWPKKPFRYRGYQRDILSDQSQYISLVGGRSIGKCHSAYDRIYTDQGYVYVSKLLKKQFRVWAYTPEGLQLRRAACFLEGDRYYYDIRTQDGNRIRVTHWHPILTPTGWKLAENIKEGDQIARVTKLPHVISPDVPDHEPRILGYLFLWKFEKNLQYHAFKLRNTAIQTDFKEQCKALGIYMRDTPRGTILDTRKTSKVHPLTNMIYFYNWYYPRRWGWESSYKGFNLPPLMMHWNERGQQNFIEGLFSQWGDISTREVSIVLPNILIARQIQEVLLRFGVETLVEDTDKTETRKSDIEPIYRTNVRVKTRDKRAVYRFLKTFKLPGFIVENLNPPSQSFDPSDFYRYDTVVSTKKILKRLPTYNIQVDQDHTYIADNLIVHNSLVLEDKLLFEILQNESELVETPEILLTTANQSQMTPILDRLVIRCMSSPLLRPFVADGLNKQKGTMDFSFDGRPVRLHARIAGKSTEQNMIGLHLPRIRIDEGQVFPLGAYRQVQPAINYWEPKTQVFICGVPNGLTNTTLYQVDQRSPRYKKYRIPAPNNPYFKQDDFIQAIKDYGGEDSDIFQQLVLGRHGKGSEQVITRDQLDIGSHDFYQYRYTAQDKLLGIEYINKLERPFFDYSMYMAGIDTGFVDPTVIQVFGLRNGKWYLCARYRLQRIEYPEQEFIIHWLHQHFNFTKICIDIGAGGGGATILQSLLTRSEYKQYRYDRILQGIMFNEHITVGYTPNNQEIKQDAKTVGAAELVRFLQGKQIALSEIDGEALSEIERIVKTRSINGQERYFILSEKGKGQSEQDHIFASFICFVMGIRDLSYLKNRKKKLGKTV